MMVKVLDICIILEINNSKYTGYTSTFAGIHIFQSNDGKSIGYMYTLKTNRYHSYSYTYFYNSGSRLTRAEGRGGTPRTTYKQL